MNNAHPTMAMTTNGGDRPPINILRDSTRPFPNNNKMASKRKQRNTTSIYLLATALLSGTVCYRLGMFAGCSSPWLSSMQDDAHATYSAPENAIQYYGSVESTDDDGDDDDDDDGDGDRPTTTRDRHQPQSQRSPRTNIYDPDDVRSRLITSVTTKGAIKNNDKRFIQRPSVPYDCGVVFFYHIPSTGGRSINQWFHKYKRPANGNISYYQHWELSVRKNGTFHPDPERCESKFANGMTQHIQNLGPNEWRIAHSHVTSTYLNESEHLLNKWRSDVEAQGCQLINTIMLRDPLNHAMSLHKIIKQKNSTKNDWADYLLNPTGTGLWGTVLDFFLYNIHGNRYHDDYPNGPGGRNPFNVTKEEKVKRAMDLLHRHFDVVTVADHATFVSRVLELTGWKHIDMPKTNVHKGVLEFTKKEVEFLQKGLRGNGDFDFVDRVKLEYHDYLSYLERIE